MPAELNQVIENYHLAGGVMDYVLFQPQQDPDSAFHRAAAVMTLEEIDRRLEVFARENSAVHGFAINKYFRLKIDAEKAVGRKISSEEFIGPNYSLPAGKLIVPGSSKAHLNNYFVQGSEEVPQNIVRIKNDGKFFTCGYASAFLGGAHGMSFSGAELNDYFHKFAQLTFGSATDELEVFEWAGAWSNYFDAGYEWWGAYLWTVHNKRTGSFTGIAASTTD